MKTLLRLAVTHFVFLFRRCGAMKTTLRLSVVLAALVVPFGGMVLRADEGRIPIFQPTTISAPGHYIVTRDILGPATIIKIQADDVVLDLNGRTLTGPASCVGSPDVIQVDTTAGGQDVVIRNGRLMSGCAGISSSGANRARIRIEKVEIESPTGAGIVINPAETVEVRDCHIHNALTAAGIGILVDGGTDSFRGRILDNKIEHVASYGIELVGLRSGAVRGNLVSDFGSAGNVAGILLTAPAAAWESGGSLVEENVITTIPGGANDDGIRVDPFSLSNYLLQNVCRRNSRYGIYSLANFTRLERNVASQGGNHGIRIGGHLNHLDGNQAQGNIPAGSFGFFFDFADSGTCKNNTGGGNFAAGWGGFACFDVGHNNV